MIIDTLMLRCSFVKILLTDKYNGKAESVALIMDLPSKV
jgi:hypothetical protein